ncbi:hypothetical protein OAA39_00370 [bacterium]|nr:hypothetical protein [bacterium]
MEAKPLSEKDIQSIAQSAVENCVDFVESEIAPSRIKAQRYYEGEVDIGEEEGRSTIVATKVRDVIRSIKPSLMRVFLQTDRAVEFIPSGPDHVQFAEQATKFVNYKFEELGGYKVLADAIHDALLKKNGIVKAYYDTTVEGEIYDFNNLNDMEFTAIVNDDGIEVVEHVTRMEIEIDQMGMEMESPRHDLKVMRSAEMGDINIESVPPEEFFVDASARNLEDAYAVCHRTDMRVGDLVEMGFAFEDVVELGNMDDSGSFADLEDFTRTGYVDTHDDDEQDLSMRKVMVTELYIKMDVDGTGVPQLHRLLLGGDNYKVLDVEEYGHLPFAVFEVDPEPHTFFGTSVADLIMNDQDSATALLRGVLDNIALTNNPRTEILDGSVNIDDVLNNEIGGVVRVKQNGSIQPLTVPFVAGQTLSAIQYYDQEIENKTGISKASLGLNPDALQAKTATAVMATMQGAASQTEIMARNLAEGGVTQLFKLLLKLVVENCDEETIMRVSGNNYEPIDPRSWDKKMDVSVNVGLGTGQEDQKQAALAQALQMQMQIFQAYGVGNGMVSLTNIRNTLADMLAMNGLRNSNRYFQPMDEQMEAQLMQQQEMQKAQQPPQMTQQEAYIQAEQIKAQAKAQSDMAKVQLDAQKAMADDDLKRDQMDQDLLVDAAKILGQYGTAVDVAAVKSAQAAPRQPNG